MAGLREIQFLTYKVSASRLYQSERPSFKVGFVDYDIVKFCAATKILLSNFISKGYTLVFSLYLVLSFVSSLIFELNVLLLSIVLPIFIMASEDKIPSNRSLKRGLHILKVREDKGARKQRKKQKRDEQPLSDISNAVPASSSQANPSSLVP